MAIAIDFGTSNTVVARWNPINQRAETISIDGLSIRQIPNPPIIPSLVYVEDASEDKVLVGQQVRDQGLDISGESRFFRNFKRGIGTNIQGFLPKLDGRTITFEQVGQWFISQVCEQLAPLEGCLDSLVLTVPVDSFEAYRHWLGKVCLELPVEQIRMLDEPTAAALGYGLENQEIFLVVDFGGGTLDLSLVRSSHNSLVNQEPLGFLLKWGNKSLVDNSKQNTKIAHVLGKVGQNLGGVDIDNWLVDYFAKTQGLMINALTTKLSEKVKVQLSKQQQVSELYFDDENLETYELKLDRDTLENILKVNFFFVRLDNSMAQLLQQARRQGIDEDDINGVLLVGGTSQIPAVQTWLKQYFNEDKIHYEYPFEAIAQGALQVTQGLVVKDFLYHSYGIRYWDHRQSQHSWHTLIKEGQSYPMTESVELLLGASSENQHSIELIIGELGTKTGSNTEVYLDGDRLFTRHLDNSQAVAKTLNDRDGSKIIVHLTPPGFPGIDRIKVMFIVDKQRFLRITVEDLLTSQILLENYLVAKLS
ncbi:Chaperone protein DnaK [Richelia intracellularis HH01]|uniref:Chaperone protein DnaK n=1 Tax=Richelia intracellularis HH01 TaxID=1165094 RepID=M1X581_9NOST|nr:Hsp70 family protein [Richelia intracellularis]CCH67156.1 Chaperone protein DnaK [Richelia intracellularis HH01]